MIKCVCLVVESNDYLLLVQARNREKYYFAGGKIDANESHREALKREVQEELQIDLPESSFVYLQTVVGEAYPQKDMQTELNCYCTTININWDSIEPDQEITDMQWIHKSERHKIAPAVLTWIDAQPKQYATINIVPYEDALISDIKQFNITAEDRKFTKTPEENIDLATKDEERHPTLVYNGDKECVGFFTLHEGQGVAPYSNNKNAIFFRSFSIDSNYRGHGYGKQVIQSLPNYLRQYFPDVNEIYLTVNTDNEIAQKLYQQCCYQNVGTSQLEGRPVYVLKRNL